MKKNKQNAYPLFFHPYPSEPPMSPKSIFTNEEELTIPLNLEDILSICREYSNLGWQVQGQVELILDRGVDASISSGRVKKENLPIIKAFLKSIASNAYFGDAVDQAEKCLSLISSFEGVHPSLPDPNQAN